MPPAPIELKANGSPRIVPMRPPLGEAPERLVKLDGQWLGLYSERETVDAAKDEFGDRLRYPYTVLNEGTQARRSFWRPKVVQAQRFDERYERFEGFEPIADAPVFLNGRFLKDYATGQPRVLESPVGLLVWHSTRIDIDGRLALTRLDASLARLWTAELPLSESSTSTPVVGWPLPGRLLVMGTQEYESDGVRHREPHLVTIALDDGRMQGWNLVQEKPLP